MMRKRSLVFLCLVVATVLMTLYFFSKRMFVYNYTNGGVLVKNAEILWTNDSIKSDYDSTKSIFKKKLYVIEEKRVSLLKAGASFAEVRDFKRILCFDLKTGEQKWVSDWAEHVQLPSSQNKFAYVIALEKEKNRNMLKYSAEGKLLKRFTVALEENEFRHADWYYNEDFFYLMGNSTLFKISSDNGDIIAKIDYVMIGQDLKQSLHDPLFTKSQMWVSIHDRSRGYKKDEQKICRIDLSNLQGEGCMVLDSLLIKMEFRNVTGPEIVVLTLKSLRILDGMGKEIRRLDEDFKLENFFLVGNKILVQAHGALKIFDRQLVYVGTARKKSFEVFDGVTSAEPYLFYWTDKLDPVLLNVNTNKCTVLKNVIKIPFQFHVTSEFSAHLPDFFPNQSVVDLPYLVFSVGGKGMDKLYVLKVSLDS